jgi:hypothetical protein
MSSPRFRPLFLIWPAADCRWAHCRYVNWPQLNPPDEILQYEGSGFRSRRNGRGRNLLGLQGRREVEKAKAQLKKLV